MVEVVAPSSLKEAVDIVRGSDGDAKYLGGGTALVLLVKMRMVNPELLVSLREVVDVPGWKDITVDNGLVHIGGGVTLTQLAANPRVRELLPSVAHSAGVVSSGAFALPHTDYHGAAHAGGRVGAVNPA